MDTTRAAAAEQPSAKDCSTDFVVEEGSVGADGQTAAQRESDRHRLAQRQKQIDFGKNTLGYEYYIQAVPK